MRVVIIYLRTMIEPKEVNEIVNFHESLNLGASAVLLLWIGFIISGIFTLVSSFVFMKFPLNLLSLLFFQNPFIIIVLLVMFFSSRGIAISLIELSKNRKWINPTKFIKNILYQVVTAIVGSILAIIIFGAKIFTGNLFLDFFLLFTVFILVISIGFIVFSFYYLYIDIYGSDRYKWEKTYKRPNM